MRNEKINEVEVKKEKKTPKYIYYITSIDPVTSTYVYTVKDTEADIEYPEEMSDDTISEFILNRYNHETGFIIQKGAANVLERHIRDYLNKLYIIKKQYLEDNNYEEYISRITKINENPVFNVINKDLFPKIKINNKEKVKKNNEVVNEEVVEKKERSIWGQIEMYDFTDMEKVAELDKKLIKTITKNNGMEKSIESNENSNNEQSSNKSKEGFQQNKLFPRNIKASSINPLSIESVTIYKQSISLCKLLYSYISRLPVNDRHSCSYLLTEIVHNISGNIYLVYSHKNLEEKINYVDSAIFEIGGLLAFFTCISDICKINLQLTLNIHYVIREMMNSLQKWRSSIEKQLNNN